MTFTRKERRKARELERRVASSTHGKDTLVSIVDIDPVSRPLKLRFTTSDTTTYIDAETYERVGGKKQP